MIGFGTAYFVAVVFALAKFTKEGWGVQKWLTLIFYTAVYLNYLAVFLGDPGVVLLEPTYSATKMFFEAEDIERDGRKEMSSENPVAQPRYDLCSICKVTQDNEMHHCHACNTCIRLIDHHCVAFGKCIAKKNLLLFHTTIGGVVLAIIMLYVQGFQAVVWSLKG